MQERIRKILEYSGLNQGLFADRISVAAATLSNILKGKTKPSLDIVQNIRVAFPEINPFWLLDGTGEMLQSNSPSQSSAPSSQSSDQDVLPLDFSSGDLFSSPADSPKVSTSQVTSSISTSQNTPSSSRMKTPTARSNEGFYPEQESVRMVKYIDKPIRKVREIQIFYDDDTYEVFVPRK